MIKRVYFMFFAFITAVSMSANAQAKNNYKTFKKHTLWEVYSIHPENSLNATVCNIKSRKFLFYLGYSAELGWALTYLAQGKPVDGIVNLYVDKKFVGKYKSYATSFGNLIPLGLDAPTLNKINNGYNLDIIKNKKRTTVNLKGIKAAFYTALDCWRNRMNSVKYNPQNLISKKTDVGRKRDIEQRTLITLLSYLGFDHLVVKNSSVYFKGSENSGMGPVGFSISYFLQGNRYAPKELAELLDDMVTKGMSKCDKFGVEKIKPFFTKNSVEVHTRIAVCALKDGGGLKYLFWAMQSNKHVTTMHIVTPIETFEDGDKSNAELIELVSKVIE